MSINKRTYLMNANKWYSMKASNKKAEITIYADIGSWGITAEAFKRELNSLGEVDSIDIRINSYGGECYDGFAIYNLLKEHKATKCAIVDGIAASMASIIAMSGNKVAMHKNAMLMIHNPSLMMAGTADDLRHEADVLDKIKKSAIEVYQTHAKDLSEKDISKLMDDSTFMTAEEAKSYGFIDEILNPVEVDEPTTNTAISVPVNIRKKVFTNKLPPTGQQPKGDIMKKCPHCGKDCPEGFDMCGHCGKPMNVTPTQLAHEKEVAEAKAAGAKMELDRQNSIRMICSANGLSTEATDKIVNTGKQIGELATEISEAIKAKAALPPVPVNPGSGVHTNKDEADKFRAHAVNSIAVMTGIIKDPAVAAEVRKGEMIGSLHGLMRRDLQRHGVDAIGMSAVQLTDAVIRMAGTGSSDLPAILGDITNKNLLKSYDEAPTTYQQWTGTKEVPDFKTQKLIKMSNFGDIDDLPEGAVFKNKKMSDLYNTVSIDTKGNTFNVSRQAMVNDDLSAIVDIPRKMVIAVRRRINKDVYDSLTSQSLTGPTLIDNVALFNLAGHYNMTTGALSITTLAAAEKLLLEMPLPKPEANSTTQYANIPAKYMIAGTGLRLTALQLLNTAFDNSKSIAGVFNPYANGAIVPVFDAYLQSKLTAGSRSNAYYLASDPTLMGHCIVAFLQGQTSPLLRSEQSGIGDAQGFTWEISFDWGIGWEDHRGIIYSAGQ